MLYGAEATGAPVSPAAKKTKEEEAEAKKDVFYMLLAVLGTLFVISALMVSPSLQQNKISS